MEEEGSPTFRLQAIVNQENGAVSYNDIARLLDSGASPNVINANTGQNYVQFICYYLFFYGKDDRDIFTHKVLQIFIRFLQCPDFDVNHVDFSGSALIHTIVSLPTHIFMEQLLIRRKRDLQVDLVVDVPEDEYGERLVYASTVGYSALQYFCLHLDPCLKTLELLLEHGANPNLIQKKNGFAAIHNLVVYSGGEASFSSLFLNTIKILMKGGCDPNLKIAADSQPGINDYDGDTALHMAISRGFFEACDILLKYCKVNVNVRNKRGETAIEYAARQNMPNMIIILLDHGADAESGLQMADRYHNYQAAGAILQWMKKRAAAEEMLEARGMHMDLNEMIMKTRPSM